MQNKKTNKASKYNYYSILQGNYGYGWDVIILFFRVIMVMDGMI